ncbi:MAG: M48 family metallopeptidase [Candidatus Diapherotrites archaeon]
MAENVYGRISSNKRNSVILFVLFVVLIAFLGVVLGAVWGDIFLGAGIAIVVSIIFVLISYYNSDSIVLAISKARPADPKEFPFLYNSVEGLAIAAGIPMPKIYVIDDTAINAFASGRDPEHSVIVVTTGAVQRLKRLELEGVIAHEMSHIKNYDVRFMTIVVVLVGIAALVSDLILRSMFWGSRGSRREAEKGWFVLVIIGIVLAILTPIIAQLVKFAISRKREFLADADGALLTRYPQGLADALKKINADKEPLEAANKATEHLYISNPLKAHGGWLDNLFSTHPPIQERIKALEAM